MVLGAWWERRLRLLLLRRRRLRLLLLRGSHAATACVERLLGARAAVDCVDANGATALQAAAERGFVDCVALVLKATSEVSRPAADGSHSWFDPRGARSMAGGPILEGTFSAVSTSIFATRYSFCCSFSITMRFTSLCTAPNSNVTEFCNDSMKFNHYVRD